MKKRLKIIAVSIGGVVIAVGLFFGGVRYGEAHSKSAFAGQFQPGQSGRFGNFANRQGSRASGAGLVSGQILNSDNQSLTVSLVGGGSRIIFLSASTTISKTSTGSLNDLQNGTNVVINGTPNPDGSLTANTIQIRPISNIPPASTNR